MSIKNRLKIIVTKTPLIKAVHAYQLKKLNNLIKKENSNSLFIKPIITISPYKTGTTYIKSCYDDQIASNDALQHYTLKQGSKNFERFFLQRFNFLKLKLDCTGFWCSYIKELATHEIAKDLNYIFVIRSPSAWIKSTINYYSFENKNHYFNFINEYFWKERIGIDIINYHNFNKEQQNKMIDNLIAFYFEIVKNSTLLKNVTYVRLENIDAIFPIIDSLTNEKFDKQRAFKRETALKYKTFNYTNTVLDKDYEVLIKDLGILDQLVV